MLPTFVNCTIKATGKNEIQVYRAVLILLLEN